MPKCMWCEYLGHLCPRCKQTMLESAPDVADDEEIPAIIYKCGCMWGGGSSTKEAHFIKLCWKHGG